MSLLKLQKIVNSGKTYYYRGNPIVVKSFDQTHGEIEILVEIDGEPQKFVKEDESKLKYFIEALKEVPEIRDEDEPQHLLPAKTKAELPVIYLEMKDTFAALNRTLIDDIEKVRTNPEYVTQAKQVCNNISAIVNITRLQLQLVQKG
jgi:hypothetical protein